jgi:hyperosmotically inducible periplasmic protein
MHTQTMFKIITLGNLGRLGALTLIALAVGLAGCKSSGDRTAGQKMSDRQLGRNVSKNLSNDPTFKYAHVHPNVYMGTVQLTGFVDTPEQRLRAAEIASTTKGTKQVINEIMIKPMATGPATIRDPLGRDTGRLLVDTNAPIPQMHNLETPQQQQQRLQQQQQEQAPGSSDNNTPK